MDRAKRTLAYAALTVIGGFTVNILGVAGYVDHVNHQRDLAEQRAAADRAAAGEQTRLIVCRLANGYARAFAENPPAAGSSGATVRDTWAALSLQFACPPS